jgi:hypothetical protein
MGLNHVINSKHVILKWWRYKVRYILVLQIDEVDKYRFTTMDQNELSLPLCFHNTKNSQVESILVLYGYFLLFYILKRNSDWETW